MIDFALCTRSSSLSISTSTSIVAYPCRAPAAWGLWIDFMYSSDAISSASELFLQALCDLLGDQILDLPPERRKLIHAALGQETVLRARHQVHGLYLRVLAPVQLAHLELVLEVGDRAQALHDRVRADPACELDNERRERLP